MQSEWDQRKAAANLRKHGIAFTDAITAFSDPLARMFLDPHDSEVEERELMVGYDSAARLLYVSFVERHDSVRIISARRATAGEASNHEKYLK